MLGILKEARIKMEEYEESQQPIYFTSYQK